MRQYLEDPLLQRFVAEFFDADKPVAAICHGVVLAARSISPRTGKSVLFGRKTTALTWALEKAAWLTMKFFGRVWDPGYYRTYVELSGEPPGYRSVQAEVTRAGICESIRRRSGRSGMRLDAAARQRVAESHGAVAHDRPGDLQGVALEFIGELLRGQPVFQPCPSQGAAHPPWRFEPTHA